MWKLVCCLVAVAVLYGSALTVILFAANWEVTYPTSSDALPNNKKIKVKGKKPDGKEGNAYVKRETSPGTCKIWSAPGPIATKKGEDWSVEVEPKAPNTLPWPNGNYKGYAVEFGGTPFDDGDVFTVVNPP